MENTRLAATIFGALLLPASTFAPYRSAPHRLGHSSSSGVLCYGKRNARRMPDPQGIPPELDAYMGSSGTKKHGSMEEFVDMLEEGMNEASQCHFRELPQCPALVLNADFQPLSYVPLSLWSWQDAIKAVLMDRVTVVASYDKVVRAPSFDLHLPSVIALKQYVNQGKKDPTFTRRNIFLRDSFSCQYCGDYFSSSHLTFDHVVPRCHGGGTSWDNVVAACRSCNNRKKDIPVKKLERQTGMRLLREPRVPSFYELQAQGRQFPPKIMHETWKEYFDFSSPAPAHSLTRVPVSVAAGAASLATQTNSTQTA